MQVVVALFCHAVFIVTYVWMKIEVSVALEFILLEAHPADLVFSEFV